jgi:diaminohydroxyphosphoribosylaminopyrimidine deaminase/5-amino-6-(5-phosphoribosylamino)uracil reductase
MALALTLARRGLGRVWPNPAVGCVIVKDGRIVGRGWTQDGGRPHAETEALRQAGPAARGATAYVTLEPCAHHGKTPPCAEALIAAGMSRVVSALEDPDSRVAGKGHTMLRAAGITVDVGTRATEARAVNAGFLARVEHGRPMVALKLATTLDGKIALPGGASRWITGERARAHVHLLRAQYDAVMIGAGTAVADDPELTSRLPGLTAKRIVRIVVDTTARLSPESKLATTAPEHPVWMLTAPNTKAPATLAGKAIEVLPVTASENGIDLSAALKLLAGRGLTRIFVEGGATLAASLVKADLVDNLLWYRAPRIMGEGIGALGSLSLGELTSLPRFKREETIRLGEDVLETYARAH